MSEELAELAAEMKALKKQVKTLTSALGMHADPRTGQVPKYPSLTVTTLVVRSDETGPAPMLILSGTTEEATISFYDEETIPRGSLSIEKGELTLEARGVDRKTRYFFGFGETDEPVLYLARKDGEPGLGMMVKGDQGNIIIADEKNRALALMSEGEHGGRITLRSRCAKPMVILHGGPGGGTVSVEEAGGQVIAFLSATPDTGSVTVYGPHGTPAAYLAGMEEGGVVILLDGEGKQRAVLPP